MFDYCLKNADEDEFNQAMLDCGLCVETDEGIMPISYQVCIDRIGSITMIDSSGTIITYPEYYTNIRLLVPPTDQQATTLALYSIDPSQPQYRVWA